MRHREGQAALGPSPGMAALSRAEGSDMFTHLDALYRNEVALADRVWLTQPLGGERVAHYTWREAVREARAIAAYLRGLEFPEGSRIALLSKNTAWWVLADMAILMSGHVTVPLYPNLGAESMRGILEHSEAKLIFLGKLDDYPAMAPGMPESPRRVLLPQGPDIPLEAHGEEVPRWRQLVNRVAPLEGHPHRDPDAVATLIYTSGSGGQQKGAMHSLRTMGAARVLVDLFGMHEGDRAISYLPLAHVAERSLLEVTSCFAGFRLFFSESKETFIEDVKRARPTLFGSVPRLLEKFREGVFEKIPESRLDTLLRIPLVRRFIRRKVLKDLGLDKVRVALVGSAPTPEPILRWYADLGLPIGELYGMTENFAISHTTEVGTIDPGWVGRPIPGVRHRIAQDGEVEVESPGTMLGYHRAEHLTVETFTSDGWIRTGDRGEIDETGRLRLIGRTKDLFKSSKGKYVSPSPIESRLLPHPLLEQVCVMGEDLPQPFAVVVLSDAARRLSPHEVEEQMEALRGEVNQNLDRHERLAKIVVVNDQWSPENGLLTPTLKLRRNAVERAYMPRAADWLQVDASIIWRGEGAPQAVMNAP